MPVRLRRLAAQEDGYIMIVTVAIMLVVSILISAALIAPSDDAPLVGNDVYQQQAYYAAQAGISDYVFHLNADNEYWTQCASMSPPGAVNLNGSVTHQQYVPGSTTEKYAIELLPASSAPSSDGGQCSTTDAVASMIESTGPNAGTFRIRSTGFADGGSVQRSIVATFRRQSFVDYVYFTNDETVDPVLYGTAYGNTPSQQCALYWRQGRPDASGSGGNGEYCLQIEFASFDSVNGPMHTNDRIYYCGSPTFGRNSGDAIEIADAAQPDAQADGCTTPGTPNFLGTLQPSTVINLPPNNAQLQSVAQSNYSYTGQTHITLTGNTMTVSSAGSTGLQGTNIALPSNGVIYDSTASNATCPTYSPIYDSYSNTAAHQTTAYGSTSVSTGCGILTVDGTTSTSLTLGSNNDIVIDGNLTTTSGALLGIVPNNFARIFHPCTYATQANPAGVNQPGYLASPTIDAAILAVNHSFFVDNIYCGPNSGSNGLGALNITGAIAQNYRGLVGATYTIQTGQNTYATEVTGYSKNYNYNDVLRYEEPPHFLDPVQASWHVLRETECIRGQSNCV